MKYLEFDVKNMAITVKNGNTKLISGAVNYFGLHFNFDDDFKTIPGAKAVEFFKNRNKIRIDLINGACAIPNELLADSKNFEMRVVSGSTIGTQWTSIGITESGAVMPEEPEEEPPAGTDYVKTYAGDGAVPYLRRTANGLQFSEDGETWEEGLDGVPDVPVKPQGAIYGRSNKDWVRIDKKLETISNSISEVKVDGTALTPVDGAVDIDLSAYAKTTDADAKYAEKSTVEALQTLSGTASQLTALDYSETDTTTIVSKINEIIGILQARGVATE